eukprot:477519_1
MATLVNWSDNYCLRKQLLKLSIWQLKEACKYKNVSAHGNKADIVQRILVSHNQPFNGKNDDWDYIYNAISHLLHNKIATSFIGIKNEKGYKRTTKNNITAILKTLQVTAQEKKYIRKIIPKAKYTFRSIKTSTEGGLQPKYNSGRFLQVDGRDIDVKFHGLNVDTLYDIHNIHNCFLFSKYQFSEYKIKTFSNDITNNIYFNFYKVDTPFILTVKSLIKPTKIPEIDLFPQYIIDDDICDVWNYFFAASSLVRELIENKKSTIHNALFSLKVCIIPRKVISVYDPAIIFEYNKINNINVYLKSKKLIWNKPATKIGHASNMLTIYDAFKAQMDVIAKKHSEITSILIIVDRRFESITKIYTVVLNNGFNKLSELDKNYCISLQFSILKRNVVRCHLFYGVNNINRIRFFPELLTTIIPRFFKRDNSLSEHDKIQKIYDDKYKHGFALNLHDPIFNKYYKIITQWSHVSVNYDRNSLQVEDMKYEYKDIKHHKLNKMNKCCSYSNKLEIEECPLIQYIVESLLLFQKMNN